MISLVEVLDLVVEAGLRLVRCFNLYPDDTKSIYRDLSEHLFVCSLTLAFLAILATSIYTIQEGLQAGNQGDRWAVERLERLTDAFTLLALSSSSLTKRFVPHIPEVAEQFQRLKDFAANLNVDI